MNQQKKIRVCIVYPADPLGIIPGGIDTFIRGILSCAPSDIEFRVAGVTTDPDARPVNQWTSCRIGDQEFGFFPLTVVRNSEKQSRIPVTLRFLLALIFNKVNLPADVLEFHRIEPILAFSRDKRPKTLVMHQNMQALRNSGADIRWKYLPSLYFRLEDFVFPRINSVYCVREDAVAAYRERYPAMSDHLHFTPTWVDPVQFQAPSSAAERRQGRLKLDAECGLAAGTFLLVTVGRLDKQKDPLLLIDAFQQLYQSMPDVRLLMVGDGVLRNQIQERLRLYGLESAVTLCGVKRAHDVSRYLQYADAFVLSSAYEGMPMCVLEALGSGLPVVTTDVGEVARVVKPGVNGEIISAHDAAVLAAAISRCRANVDIYRGDPCTSAVQDFTPKKVLEPIYENYRSLANRSGRG